MEYHTPVHYISNYYPKSSKPTSDRVELCYQSDKHHESLKIFALLASEPFFSPLVPILDQNITSRYGRNENINGRWSKNMWHNLAKQFIWQRLGREIQMVRVYPTDRYLCSSWGYRRHAAKLTFLGGGRRRRRSIYTDTDFWMEAAATD